MAVRVCPLEEEPDRALGHAGDGSAGARIGDRRHPEVPDAVDRGDVSDPGAVERELRPGDVRIAEERLARHERARGGGLGASRPREPEPGSRGCDTAEKMT